MNPAIKLENVCKRYRITSGRAAYRTFRESLMDGLTGLLLWSGAATHRGSDGQEYIWALSDVSLEIQPGEVVGVIGHNGAGKSTLLKILARTTEPTRGRVEFRGRVGSLLDVGTGFHSELAGRENIYLNGAILGMTRSEITRKLDEIVDFAGIGQFLDTPLKYYSEGMRMRLAFAVAAHLDTEILLADEVLGLGDVEFQQKCLDTMGSLARSGRTVLFVNHNMGAIGRLCAKTLLLEKGRTIAFGPTAEVIDRYLSGLQTRPSSAELVPPLTDKGITLRSIAVYDGNGSTREQLLWRRPFVVAVEFSVTRRVPALSLSVTLTNHLGVRVMFSWIAFQQAFDLGLYRARGEFAGESLVPGRYFVEALAEHHEVEHYHHSGKAVSFQVVDTIGEFGSNLDEYGLTFERVGWQMEAAAPAAAWLSPH